MGPATRSPLTTTGPGRPEVSHKGPVVTVSLPLLPRHKAMSRKVDVLAKRAELNFQDSLTTNRPGPPVLCFYLITRAWGLHMKKCHILCHIRFHTGLGPYI